MALPAAIDPATPGATDSPGQGDDHIRNLKQFIVDVFGLPASPTQVAAAAMSISAAGVVTLSQGNSLFQLGSVSSPSLGFVGRTSTGLYSSAADTLDFSAGGVRVASLVTAAIGVNYLRFTPAATGAAPIIDGQGSDANVSLKLDTKADGVIDLFTGGARAAQIARVASAVNYFLLTHATATNPIVLSPAGSDSNITLKLDTKGTGVLDFFTGGTRAIQVARTASAVNYLTVTPGAAGSDVILATAGSDSNIDLEVNPKGTGVVRITSTEAGAIGVDLDLFHNSPSPADSDVPGQIRWFAKDDGGTSRLVGAIETIFDDVTSTTMDSTLRFYVMDNVNAGGASTTATLSSLGVWTDSSVAAGKEYIGDVSNVITKARQLSTLGVYRGKNLPVGKQADAEVHFSPTAEDFYQVFRLGKNPTKGNPGIAPKDVAFLAIRGLLELEDRVAALEAK